MDEDEDGNKTPVSDVIIDEIKTMQTDVTKMKEAYMSIRHRQCAMHTYMPHSIILRKLQSR